jgi:hypothetical protein
MKAPYRIYFKYNTWVVEKHEINKHGMWKPLHSTTSLEEAEFWLNQFINSTFTITDNKVNPTYHLYDESGQRQ